MGSNILVTGAAGYVGGSLIADFLASKDTLIKKEHISAAVRTEEQAKALNKLGINVLQLDLTDEKAVVESLLRHQIRIVIHCASSLDERLALYLITALSKQQEISGEETHFIHTSGLSAFYENAGWPSGETKDTDLLFEIEKQLADSSPLRKTDVAVTEYAKAKGVTSFIVVPSTVYGKGRGEWNQVSVVFPIYIQASIAKRKVYKFAENTKVSGVHITDLTALYTGLIDKILRKETIPSGADGYYFALAHDVFWWNFLDQLAATLKSRGIVANSKTEIWPSDEVAADSLGVPVQLVQMFFNSGENIVAENTKRIGWKPLWNGERFMQSIDEEIQVTLDLGKAKSSLLDSLFGIVKK